MYILILLIGSFLQCIYDIFVTNSLSEKEAKKANYDCSNCKNWRCYYYHCQEKRSQLK